MKQPATKQPCSQAALQPSSPAAKQPCSQAALQRNPPYPRLFKDGFKIFDKQTSLFF
jgi:hypothetical protein